jgi:flagellar hook protein FlgE
MAPINTALQGLSQAETTFEMAADRIARASQPNGGPEDSVSLSDDAVSLIDARNAYEMNLRTLSVANQMSQKLLDILA